MLEVGRESTVDKTINSLRIHPENGAYRSHWINGPSTRTRGGPMTVNGIDVSGRISKPSARYGNRTRLHEAHCRSRTPCCNAMSHHDIGGPHPTCSAQGVNTPSAVPRDETGGSSQEYSNFHAGKHDVQPVRLMSSMGAGDGIRTHDPYVRRMRRHSVLSHGAHQALEGSHWTHSARRVINATAISKIGISDWSETHTQI